jgi:hypothetical protein
MSRLTIATMAILAMAGCKKKDDDGKGGAAKASEGAAAVQKLPRVGLQIALDGEVSFDKEIGGDGDMVTGAGVGALTVSAWAKPQTIDEAKEDASLYSPKNLKQDKLADGWTLTYENTGSMGTNYFVTVRRDLGGKTYKCTTTGSEAAQAQAALAACKSLKP